MKQINQLLKKKGFEEFAWIDARDIEVAHWVRIKCQYGCNDYGGGTCPPNTPPVEECRKFFNEYQKAIIIKLEVEADKACYPSEWSKSMTSKLLSIEKEVFLMNKPKTFLLNQTCCCSCTQCSNDRINCTDKQNARPSPEGFSVDVYKTVNNAGLDIQVITHSPSIINRVAILLVE